MIASAPAVALPAKRSKYWHERIFSMDLLGAAKVEVTPSVTRADVDGSPNPKRRGLLPGLL